MTAFHPPLLQVRVDLIRHGVLVEGFAEVAEGAVVPLDAEVPFPLEVFGVSRVVLVQVQQVLG